MYISSTNISIEEQFLENKTYAMSFESIDIFTIFQTEFTDVNNGTIGEFLCREQCRSIGND